MADQILGVTAFSYRSQTYGMVLLRIVLYGDLGTSYAAYIGEGDPDFIRQNGDKLLYEQAIYYFKGVPLDQGKYSG